MPRGNFSRERFELRTANFRVFLRPRATPQQWGMHNGRFIFSELISHLPQKEFQKCVARYDDGSQSRTFSHWDQYLTMAFAQLTDRESLRDIEACLRSVTGKLYHLGIRSKVARTTLADANESRDWRIFADFAQVLIRIARPLYAADPIGVDLDHSVYALDSTTIDLCLSLFPWAKFRRHKGAVKMHTLLDLHGNIPTFISITNGKVHDVNKVRAAEAIFHHAGKAIEIEDIEARVAELEQALKLSNQSR